MYLFALKNLENGGPQGFHIHRAVRIGFLLSQGTLVWHSPQPAPDLASPPFRTAKSRDAWPYTKFMQAILSCPPSLLMACTGQRVMHTPQMPLLHSRQLPVCPVAEDTLASGGTLRSVTTDSRRMAIPFSVMKPSLILKVPRPAAYAMWRSDQLEIGPPSAPWMLYQSVSSGATAR